ncbi:hypothetical protein FRB99_004082 [Tulasnella sp. 403]|nr:hypothetical protein FRB99_004082 [Tulasnella sp. 403]
MHAGDLKTRLKTALDEHAKRDAEVAALRDFLCLHNFSSESDVCDRVNHLNNVIEGTAQQFADFCVEACRASQGSPSNKSDTPSLGATANLLELKSASQLQERLEEILGRRLFSKLKKSSSPDDNIQLPLQWAFQTLIVQMVAYDCLDPFCFVSWVEDGPPDDTLVQLCGDIQRQEPQSSFGRWRSMTFKHLRQSTPETDQQRLIDEAVDKAVLWCYAVTSVTFRERNLDLHSFTESCKTSMVEIFEEARKLVIMVREEIVTAQYESNVPVSGDAFDKDLMVLEGGDTPEEGDEVVCTVRLGMTRSYKGSREATATVVKEGFVKAEVITRRILKDLA